MKFSFFEFAFSAKNVLIWICPILWIWNKSFVRIGLLLTLFNGTNIKSKFLQWYFNCNFGWGFGIIFGKNLTQGTPLWLLIHFNFKSFAGEMLHHILYFLKSFNTERYRKSSIPAMIRMLNEEELSLKKSLSNIPVPREPCLCVKPISVKI